MPTGSVRVSPHAWDQIVSRFGPPSPQLWAERAFGVGVAIGETRDGRTVYETPEAYLVVSFRAWRTNERRRPVIVTVMPSSWPIEIVGGAEYVWRGDRVPAAPASLQRLADRFRRD
jgi:hypothetical protein